jgi:hypothetical protein
MHRMVSPPLSSSSSSTSASLQGNSVSGAADLTPKDDPDRVPPFRLSDH